MLHFHFGSTPLGLDKVVRALFATEFAITINGDGWNSWGDRVGSATNDDVTMHVVVEVADAEAARRLVKLLPQTELNSDRDLYVLTEVENWQNVLDLNLELNDLDPEVRSALDRLLEHARFAEEYHDVVSSNNAAYRTVLKALGKSL